MKNELLHKISDLITATETSESDADHLMTLIRKLQERTNGQRNSYPLLNFFCDWTKHSTLDRNSEGHKVIIEFNDRLFELKDSLDHSELTGGLSQIISFERLQSELAKFLSFYELPNDIVTNKELWLRYVIHLVNIVSDCGLQLPKKKRGKVSKSIKDGVIVISLKYRWLNEGVFNSNQRISKQKILTLVIGLSDTTTIVLQCKILGKFLTKEDCC